MRETKSVTNVQLRIAQRNAQAAKVARIEASLRRAHNDLARAERRCWDALPDAWGIVLNRDEPWELGPPPTAAEVAAFRGETNPNEGGPS